MSQTKAGAAKAVAKILARDPDFYKKTGALGGKVGHTGGFFQDRELARRAGAIGGKISKRRKVEDTKNPTHRVQINVQDHPRSDGRWGGGHSIWRWFQRRRRG